MLALKARLPDLKGGDSVVSIKVNIPMCAVLYILYNRPLRLYQLRSIMTKLEIVDELARRGLVLIFDSPKVVKLTKLGKAVVEKNIYTCRSTFQTFLMCKRDNMLCRKLEHTYTLITLL